MGVITVIIAINSFYIYQILLNEMKYEIELVKELLYFIPDNLIDEKSKAKKKSQLRASNKSSKNLDEWSAELGWLGTLYIFLIFIKFNSIHFNLVFPQ